MATLNLGHVRPVYKGVWDASKGYAAYDWVRHGDNSYIALKGVPANYKPDAQPEYWQIFGTKGDTGEQGIQGERGFHFTPTVNEAGDLSWSNDGGLENPPTVNIKGPQGEIPLMSDSPSLNSSVTAASSAAVKTVNDKVIALTPKVDASVNDIAINGRTITYRKNSGASGNIVIPEDTNDKVRNTPSSAVKAYITATTNDSDSVTGQVFDTGVYLTQNAGEIAASIFVGNLTGNVTGNVTGNADTATTAVNVSDISDATDSDSSVTAASSKAVKTVATVATGAKNVADGAKTAADSASSVAAAAQTAASTAMATAAAAQTSADSAVSAVSALSSECVKTTGNQIIDGAKTFSSAITASGGVVGDVTGNAASATKLQTARTINGVSFDGTANISVTCVPIGMVLYLAASSAPSDYLVCNGAAVSRTTYANLFKAIGTTWGAGNGSTTFNLPNLIGRFLEGATTAGAYKGAGLPDIWAFTGSNLANQTFINATGAFEGMYPQGNWIDFAQKKLTGGFNSLDFKASRSNAIYGASSTVQPASVTVLPCIKY